MKTFLFCFLIPFALWATQREYFALFDHHPNILGPLGEVQEIEVLLNEEEIAHAEKIAENRLLDLGITQELAKEWSRVGIINEDQYLYWIRDAVRFPSGDFGTYDRILWKSGLNDSAGVGVLPVLPDGKVLVNLNYRHATRSWEIELPRGMRHPNETIEDTIKREVQEETGGQIDSFICLGELNPDSGILCQAVPVYLGWISAVTDNAQEFSEAIAANPIFTVNELKALYRNGTILLKVNGKDVEAKVRDAFLAYALFQAEIRGLLSTFQLEQ